MTFYLHSVSVTSLMAWLISWLPSLLVISSCVWILSGAVGENTNEEWPQLFDPLASPILIMMPGTERKGKHTRPFIASMILILVLGAGLSLGYGVRDHQLVKNTHTYFDVKVLDKYSDTKYLLQPVRMQPWISNPCEPVYLSVGATMKFYTYEQMTIPDCHRVKSFEFYANSKGERIDADADLQVR